MVLGTDIVFFPGGAPGGSFETVVYNGALAAATDTGANVEYVWSDWNPEKMISQFSEAMATNPDGIAVMGYPGNDAFQPLVDDAESKGILVTTRRQPGVIPAPNHLNQDFSATTANTKWVSGFTYIDTAEG